MNINDFNFDLPQNLIAQTPLINRSDSKLLVLNKENGDIEHKNFRDIVELLDSNDILVLNDTKVIPSRITGIKQETSAVIELLLLNEVEATTWIALTKPAKRVKIGTVIDFGNKLKAECIEILDDGIRKFKLIYDGILYEILDELGTMPLPPYITKKLDDPDKYQTVYAKNPGSAAAPTAGLHFTKDVLNDLEKKGVEVLYITLHVGLGTFRPVMVENILDHTMHSEYYEISDEVASKINNAKKYGKSVVSVGTTTTRVLESVSNKFGTLKGDVSSTDIFIYPGYNFLCVDKLITNFHLPKSTLLMLISAFSNRDYIMKAYSSAIDHQYRFFSFGDSMFIK
ncbi:MAG: tRNA preQ1(34) S-adenosylmethionine ribosyltransferase-isomerase QueA [Bacilli bacterium]